MFCQACGAQNADKARFCNMCGAQIAQPGDPDGPRSANATQLGRPMVLPEGVSPGGAASATTAPDEANAAVQPSTPSAPQVTRPAQAAAAPSTEQAPLGAGASAQNVWAMHAGGGDAGVSGQSWSGVSTSGALHRPDMSGTSMSGVTLSGLGIQSPARTWAVLIGGALLLFVVGALSMWLLMGRGEPGEESEVGETGASAPDDLAADLREDFEVGTPLPEGVEPPEVDFVSGDVRPVRKSEPPPRTTVVRAKRSSRPPSAAPSPDTRANGARAERTPRAETGGQGSSSSGDSANAGSASNSAGEQPSEASGGGATAGGTGAANTVPTEVPEDRDMAMELYTGRVRFVIRRYYAARAQSCFDRATRNEQELRGTVVVSFTIGADGQVGRTSVARNTTGNDTLGTCLAGQMSSWRLPPPPNGEIELQMPFSR